MTSSTIKVEGRRLNAKHGAELELALDAEWRSGAPFVVIDLSGLEAADSLGLGALVRVMRLKPKERRLVLRNVCPTIVGAMKLAQLLPLFEFESPLDKSS